MSRIGFNAQAIDRVPELHRTVFRTGQAVTPSCVETNRKHRAPVAFEHLKHSQRTGGPGQTKLVMNFQLGTRKVSSSNTEYGVFNHSVDGGAEPHRNDQHTESGDWARLSVASWIGSVSNGFGRASHPIITSELWLIEVADVIKHQAMARAGARSDSDKASFTNK